MKNILCFVACIVFLAQETRAQKGKGPGRAKCRNPNGVVGDVIVDGCDQLTCTAISKKKGIWVEGPAINDCCVYNGTMAPVDTEVDYISPDYGCTHISLVCEMWPEGPSVYPRVEFSCFETLTDGIQMILEYFSMTWPQYPATVSGPQYNGTYNGTEYKKPRNKDIKKDFKRQHLKH